MRLRPTLLSGGEDGGMCINQGGVWHDRVFSPSLAKEGWRRRRRGGFPPSLAKEGWRRRRRGGSTIVALLITHAPTPHHPRPSADPSS